MAAAVAVSSLALGFLCSLPHRPSSSRFPSLSPRKAGRSTIVATAGPPTRGSSRPRGTPAQEERDVNNGFLPQEDLSYLWKLAAASIGGATIIKYGSALFPVITRPNILQALLMIGIPVIVSVFLLVKESASNRHN